MSSVIDNIPKKAVRVRYWRDGEITFETADAPRRAVLYARFWLRTRAINRFEIALPGEFDYLEEIHTFTLRCRRCGEALRYSTYGATREGVARDKARHLQSHQPNLPINERLAMWVVVFLLLVIIFYALLTWSGTWRHN